MPTGSPEVITFRGVTLTTKEWSRRLGISLQRLHQRLSSMPLAAALEPDPVARQRHGQGGRRALYLYQGKRATVDQIARAEGVSRRTVYNRIAQGKLSRVQGRTCSICGKVGHDRGHCPRRL